MTRPARPSDPPLQRADLPAGPFSYTDEGSGPAVVAVPGYPGGPRDFRWLAPALGADLRLIRLCMPGFGETPLSTEPAVDLVTRARFVAAAIDALGLPEVLVVGHSMGGALAGLAATELDTAVRGVALLCSIGPTPHPGVRDPRLHHLRRVARWPAVGWAVRRSLPAIFEHMGFPRRWSIPQLLHTLDCAAGLDFAPWAERIPTLPAPTLVAWGQDDPLIPTPIAEALAQRAPAGPRLAFPSGGHNIQKHHAVEIAAAIRGMLGLPAWEEEAAATAP